ncbi:MAG TPA: FRG domain-containing protein [Spirochaetota bacterium]|nr:MAG: FRG domain protein [Spirochaetes bacterium ADurb.Bin133]HPY88951.1 FRG domain-containing protein [Spirochaetota bacterium]
MDSIKNNLIIKRYIDIFDSNDFVYINSEQLNLKYRIESEIKKYNKIAKTGLRLIVNKNNKENLERIRTIVDKDNSNKNKLLEIDALIKLKDYFSKMGIPENSTNKKRNIIFDEIKKLYPTIQISVIYNEILFKKDNIDFVNISSLSNFTRKLNENKLISKNIYYRGQNNINWEVKPSIFRGNWIKHEQDIIKEMVLRNPSEFEKSNTTLEKLTKMQHYNAPTRLLDLTRNPYIALFFACEENNEQEELSYGEVIFFESNTDPDKYYDSDTVSVLSNISMMSSDFSIDSKIKDKEEFNKSLSVSYLIHQIQYEKPNFVPMINPDDFEKCLIVHVKLDNKRIINQQGLFLLVGMKEKKVEPTDIKKYMKYKNNKRIVFIINHKNKSKILQELDIMNINKGYIYPEIDDVAEYIKNNIYKIEET